MEQFLEILDPQSWSKVRNFPNFARFFEFLSRISFAPKSISKSCLALILDTQTSVLDVKMEMCVESAKSSLKNADVGIYFKLQTGQITVFHRLRGKHP